MNVAANKMCLLNKLMCLSIFDCLFVHQKRLVFLWSLSYGETSFLTTLWSLFLNNLLLIHCYKTLERWMKSYIQTHIHFSAKFSLHRPLQIRDSVVVSSSMTDIVAGVDHLIELLARTLSSIAVFISHHSTKQIC